MPPYPSTQAGMTPSEKADFSKQLNQMLPPDRLNGMLALVQNNLLCDSDCQREKKIVELKERMNQASSTVKTAANDLSQAEKNYYEYKEGPGEYLDYLLDKNKKEFEKVVEDMTSKELESYKQVISLIYGFSAEKIHAKEMNKLVDILIKKNTDLKVELDSIIGNTTTSDRKIDYQSIEIDWLHKIRYFLYTIYFLLLILYILFGNFIRDKLYVKKESWLYIFLYFSLPFLISYLSIFSFWIYAQISRLLGITLPRNVYVNL
jgi:hypothetical protein